MAADEHIRAHDAGTGTIWLFEVAPSRTATTPRGGRRPMWYIPLASAAGEWAHAMTFHSILFAQSQDRVDEAGLDAPAFFADLHLDQIVEAITTGKDGYHLKPFFYAPLHDLEAIEYRRQVMKDLEDTVLFECIQSFSQRMQVMRDRLARAAKLHYRYEQARWFLDAVEVYGDAVTGLAENLAGRTVTSKGFTAFREYLRSYVDSERFTSLLAEANKIKADLSAITYCLLITNDSVTVRPYEHEPDYSVDVEHTFERFKQGPVKRYTGTAAAGTEMSPVDARVLDYVAKLYPGVFLTLDHFFASRADYQDDTIRLFDREVQFYVAYRQYIERFLRAGLPVCYPRVSNDKRVCGCDGYDFALADTLIAQQTSVTCNDFSLRDAERIVIVSGPNQGGKTTWARAFGQVHYLATLGCPVAGTLAHTLLFDHLFTHFEREEHIDNLRGKLEDDLVRIHDIVRQATPNSLIIMNEIFTSTTLSDAVFLSKKVIDAIMKLDLLCVWVTFIDELASLGEKTVSMVSTVASENPAVRTYKILRRPADGLAYAISIAEKYRLTYQALRGRIKS